MKKDIELALRNSSVYGRYGISCDTEMSGVYFKFLVNKETIEFLKAQCFNGKKLMRMVFVLHLARYLYSKKLGNVIYRTLTSSKTEKSALLHDLDELGLLKHRGYWPGHEAAEYSLKSVAEADGAYSFAVDDLSLQELLWTIYRKEIKAVEMSNNWEGVRLPENWDSLADISDVDDIDELRRLVEKINNGIVEPYRKQSQEYRLYSSFTRLNKNVRPFLTSRYKKRFCLVDVKTSQPRLVPVVLREMMNELLGGYAGVTEYLNWLSERGVRNQQADLIDSIGHDISALTMYFNDENNDFYSDSSGFDEGDRDIMKKNVMVLMNSTLNEQARMNDKRIRGICEYLSVYYPFAYQFILYCKYQEYGMSACAGGKGGWKYYRYSFFYRLCELESELMLEDSCPEFRKKFKDANIITIHDGVMVEKENVEAMKLIMMNAYSRRGVRAILDVEDYCDCV